MYKIIKVDEKMILVGDVETKSVIRVKAENAYDSAMVNDLVELFSDGEDNYIAKVEVKQTVVEFPKPIDEPKKPTKKPSIDTPEIEEDTNEENLVTMNFKDLEVMKHINSAIDIVKRKKLYINSLIFVGVSLAVAMILSILLKEQIMKVLSESIGYYINDYIPEDFLNPFALAYVLMLAGLKVTINAEFFISIQLFLNANVPFVLSAIVIFGTALFVTKNYISKQSSKAEQNVHLFLSLLLGWLMLSVVAFFLKFNLNESVSLKLFANDFIWRSGILILLLLGLFGIDFSLIEIYIPWKNIISFFFRKLKVTMLLGVILTIIISTFVAKDQSFLFAVGNFIMWFPLVFLGGKVQLHGNIGFGSFDMLGINHIGAPLYFTFLVITLFIWFVDVDDLKKYLPKQTNMMISAYFSIFSGVSIYLISLISDFNLNVNFYDEYYMNAKTDISSLLIVTAVIFGLTFVRLELGRKYPLINTLKMTYKKYIKF